MYTRRLLESSYDKYIPCTRKKENLLVCLALKVIHARCLVFRNWNIPRTGINLCREKFGWSLLILVGTLSFRRIVWVSTMIPFNDFRVLSNILIQVSPLSPRQSSYPNYTQQREISLVSLKVLVKGVT